MSDQGYKVGVVNVPMTYPPEKVNGFLVSGFLAPMNAEDFTYPLSLAKELKQRLGKYMLHPIAVREGDNFSSLLKEKYQMIANRTEACLYLMEKYEWDFFIVHYIATDSIQHELWHIADATHPQHKAEYLKKYGNVIFDFFVRLDQLISQILAKIDENTSVIIMSDHGFGPLHNAFNLNTWLLQEGFIRLKGDLFTKLKHLMFKMGITPSFLYKVAMRMGIANVSRRVDVGKKTALLSKLFLSLADVDWTKTEAYSLGYYGYGNIDINLKGREPLGIVEDAQYKTLINKIRERLCNIKDSISGEPIVEKVYEKDELFHGQEVEKAPDLMTVTKNLKSICIGVSDFPSRHVIEPSYGHVGSHQMNGIFLAKGPNIKKGSRINNAGIIDLAPTILYLLNSPILKDMDGKILSEIFMEDFLKRSPIYVDDIQSRNINEFKVYTEEEERSIKKTLRNLGYI